MLFHTMHQLLGGRDPYKQQVRVLCQLVYQLEDTILVTKTGFGKSIVFYTFSILIGQITIQLIPLSKLGEKQVKSIHQYPGTKPCLVIADTKFQNPQLLEQIMSSMYTYILFRLEQAMFPEFYKILQNSYFQQ